jgi:hypothetical protein
VIELVGGGIVGAEGRILLSSSGLDQRVGVFLAADRGDLHVVTAAGGARRTCGVGPAACLAVAGFAAGAAAVRLGVFASGGVSAASAFFSPTAL